MSQDVILIAFGVGVGLQTIGAERRTVRKLRPGLPRPLVADEAGDGDVERVVGVLRVAVEDPLSGVR